MKKKTIGQNLCDSKVQKKKDKLRTVPLKKLFRRKIRTWNNFLQAARKRTHSL